MEAPPLPYVPGSAGVPALPLARYLPPLPEGMVAGWLHEHVPPDSWVLDPLGASPTLALEAARAGYRVLVAANNPVIRFLIETLAQAPTQAEFQAALADLAVTKRGGERLEAHIQGIYATTCENCGSATPAEAFLWRKDSDSAEARPYARIYTCRACHKSPDGERPVTPEDLERLAEAEKDTLQRARAIQRVVMDDTEHRTDVEEALECYPPRALSVLFTLINKVEGLGAAPEKLRLYHALLLSAFDQGSTLAQWSGGRARPKQLTAPAQFRENNLWLAVEAAVADWATTHPPDRIAVTHWPNLPAGDGGAICLFHGRVKTLVPLPANLQPAAVVTAYLRPNQAFWTLSTLWTGWLWGPQAALPLRSVLERRRYDWNWYTLAIHSVMDPLCSSLPPGTPMFGLLPELNAGFLSAAVVATRAGGFALRGLALRAERYGKVEHDLAQTFWQPAVDAPPATPSPPAGESTALPTGAGFEQAARAAIQADLLARNEPAAYLTLHGAALRAINPLLPAGTGVPAGDLHARVQAAIGRILADRAFLQLNGGAGEESGWWWLEGQPRTTEPLPLADRIEMEVARWLQRSPVKTLLALQTTLHGMFPELQTPEQDWLLACLESYGETLQTGTQEPLWQLRPEENAPARRNDLQEVDAALLALGAALGYRIEQREKALLWIDQHGRAQWRFYRMASSIVSRFVFAEQQDGEPVLVLPGSRAPLLARKRLRDPGLNDALAGWHILKFRHLRSLLERKLTSEQEWLAALEEDPIVYEWATQMTLFAR